MEPDQRRLNLEGLIRKLRSVTLAVQIMPFIYATLYLISMCLYWIDNEKVLAVLDTLFYISPIVAAQFLVLSSILNLCNWHKTACLLPVIPQAAVLADGTVLHLSVFAVKFYLAVTMLFFLLLLVAAYNVFFNGKGASK